MYLSRQTAEGASEQVACDGVAVQPCDEHAAAHFSGLAARRTVGGSIVERWPMGTELHQSVINGAGFYSQYCWSVQAIAYRYGLFLNPCGDLLRFSGNLWLHMIDAPYK